MRHNATKSRQDIRFSALHRACNTDPCGKLQMQICLIKILEKEVKLIPRKVLKIRFTYQFCLSNTLHMEPSDIGGNLNKIYGVHQLNKPEQGV